MKFLVVLFAAVACASASGLLGAAPLVPKVQVGPTQLNIVKQPITVQQPVSVPRSVPYPVKAISYTAPVVHSPVIAPAPVAYAAAPVAYAAAPAYAHTYAAAPAYAHGYAAPLAAAYAHPGLVSHSTIALAH